MKEKVIELKKGQTSGRETAIVIQILDDGTLEFDGDTCRIVDEKENFITVLHSGNKTTAVKAQYKGYVIRGEATLGE